MQSNWDLFMRRIVTGDETWIHHYDHAVEVCLFFKPLQFEVRASAGKIICTVFWDAQGILLIDYMPHKVTIAIYYADLLQKLHVAIKREVPRKVDPCTPAFA